MKVCELQDILEYMDPDAEVRLAFQPSYPLQYYCVGAVSREEFGAADDLDATENYAVHAGRAKNKVLWLLASSTEVREPDGNPYFPREAWDWRQY